MGEGGGHASASVLQIVREGVRGRGGGDSLGFDDAAVHVIVVPPPKGPLRLLDLLSPAPPTHPPACACAVHVHVHVHVLCVYTLLSSCILYRDTYMYM